VFGARFLTNLLIYSEYIKLIESKGRSLCCTYDTCMCVLCSCVLLHGVALCKGRVRGATGQRCICRAVTCKWLHRQYRLVSHAQLYSKLLILVIYIHVRYSFQCYVMSSPRKHVAASHAQSASESTFLFTSESVGEGHPGEKLVYNVGL